MSAPGKHPHEPNRHPAEVTADRLGRDYERFYDQLTDRERDAIGTVRNALQEIAAGNR